jgi:hypothetical protein
MKIKIKKKEQNLVSTKWIKKEKIIIRRKRTVNKKERVQTNDVKKETK